MKVLYIIDYGTVGGATHSFLELVVAMKQRGVQPVVCLGKVTDIIEMLDKEGIEFFCAGHRTMMEPFEFKGLRWPYRLFKIAARYFIKESKALRMLQKMDLSDIDIIHTNSARNDIGCFLNKWYSIPHLMHVREFADADFNCIMLRPNYLSFYNRYTTRFVCISDAVRRYWTEKGLNDSKMDIIYNGIHHEDISVSSDESKRGVDLHMLMAGGVCFPKGQHLAVEAIGLLPKGIRNHVSLDIAGWQDRQYVAELKKKAKKGGYGERICFLGSIGDVHERMGSYQIGLMCSRAEGFGRVTAEYMHGRLGVIASDTGANPELIEDSVTGMLFKSGDAMSLSACITKLYRDREFLIRLSNAAQRKANSYYTQNKNADAIYELYSKILK